MANASREAGKLARYAARSRSTRAVRRSLLMLARLAVIARAYAGPGPRGWWCPAAQGSAGHRAAMVGLFLPRGTTRLLTRIKPDPRRKQSVTIRNRSGSTARGSALRLAVVRGQPVLGRQPEHDLIAAGDGLDVRVAALGAQVPSGQFPPLVLGRIIEGHRALDRDVLVRRVLVLGAQGEPAGRHDGRRLARAAAGAHVHGAAGCVGVPDRDGQRAAAVQRRDAEHPHVQPGEELLALLVTHVQGHGVSLSDLG